MTASFSVSTCSPLSYPCRCFETCTKQPLVSLYPSSIQFSRVLKRRDRSLTWWILNATPPRVLDNAPSPTSTAATGTGTGTRTIEIPVSCYQLIGVSDQAEKDEIVKSVMQLKRAEVEDGYTLDAVTSRQNLLMDVRDKLLFEPEYAGNVRAKIPPKPSLQIPWAWLPGALCLLQEVGEEKLVLDIGRAALQLPEAKLSAHDLILSMALAECEIAKISFEKNKVSYGFEALARAQCLLKSSASLAKMALLSQIEDSLEELAPACTLEILGIPNSPENVERRQKAIGALRELLKQGLDVESSCRIQDWPCFLAHAFSKLRAMEIVDLLPWVDLAAVRKNKKSLGSHNQRVVIDLSCFYLVLLAHVALGFSSKQTEMINKAKAICECLMVSEGVDLKFEEAFCLFLLGQGNEAEAVEKLQRLELSSNPAVQSLPTGKEINGVSGGKPSLEMWLKDVVLSPFPDTRDCFASLSNFFQGEKRSFGNRKSLQTSPSIGPRQVSDIPVRRIDGRESPLPMNSSQQIRSAVKQLFPYDSESSLVVGKNGGGSKGSEPSNQLKRNPRSLHDRAWESWFGNWDVMGKISSVAILGCIGFLTFKISGVKRITVSHNHIPAITVNDSSSFAWERNPPLGQHAGPAYIGRSGIADRMKKMLNMVKKQSRTRSEPGSLDSSGLATGRSSSVTTISKKPMPLEEAEALVKQWQEVKAEALGPSHQMNGLTEVLDESMLAQWQALAEAAKARSCYWRFVLLQLSVLQADIFLDKLGMERAEIEAFLGEAAELVDESQPRNPNYYSTYKVRYVLKREDNGSWKFCQGDIQTPS